MGIGIDLRRILHAGQSLAVWRDADTLPLSATCPERGDAPVLTHAVAHVT